MIKSESGGVEIVCKRSKGERLGSIPQRLPCNSTANGSILDPHAPNRFNPCTQVVVVVVVEGQRGILP